MKIIQIIFLLIFNATSVVGQDKILTQDSDTVFWKVYFNNLYFEIGLEPIQKIQGDLYFRFYDGRKVIELHQVDNKLSGFVTFVLQQYKKDKEGLLYFKKIILTAQGKDTILSLVNKYKIIELPTDKKIPGWTQGLDGFTYLIEHSDKTSYSTKNYWSPVYYQNTISEAKQLVDFIGSLSKIDELIRVEKKFMDKQPFSSWYNRIGGSTISALKIE